MIGHTSVRDILTILLLIAASRTWPVVFGNSGQDVVGSCELRALHQSGVEVLLLLRYPFTTALVALNVFELEVRSVLCPFSNSRVFLPLKDLLLLW